LTLSFVHIPRTVGRNNQTSNETLDVNLIRSNQQEITQRKKSLGKPRPLTTTTLRNMTKVTGKPQKKCKYIPFDRKDDFEHDLPGWTDEVYLQRIREIEEEEIMNMNKEKENRRIVRNKNASQLLLQKEEIKKKIGEKYIFNSHR